ncbi:nucleolar rna helicase 2-like [Stylonychia lemnae]|uniref:Nucleolar rna helicase 2-like n=1 Tax=Stylonychia lemnae TaxID=5949 RepID=A0A077ZYW9_STYLE|nr:nucleolar rna helicase 2-like [Stylonychia lemnae]|eukprot:CDW74353.1 nucleolar rna helicase 2-like [Stylonychia lemnae]
MQSNRDQEHLRKKPEGKETYLKGEKTLDENGIESKIVLEDKQVYKLVDLYDATEKRSSPMTEIVVNTKEIEDDLDQQDSDQDMQQKANIKPNSKNSYSIVVPSDKISKISKGIFQQSFTHTLDKDEESLSQVKKRDLKSESKSRISSQLQFDDCSNEDQQEDHKVGHQQDTKQKGSASCTDDEADKGSFERFPEISQVTVNNLKSRGIKYLFPVQQQCFYPIYDGEDVIGRDLTGSGKTLAFALPLVEKFREQKLLGTRKLQAIVLAPTRELAVQVQNEFARLKDRDDEYSTVTVYGGVSIEPQISALKRGVEFFVGTTGRVLDHIERGNIDFSSIKTVILDEADQMLKLGFKEDVEKILLIIKQNITRTLQICMFSATIPQWVKEIAIEHMREQFLFMDLAKDLKNKTAQKVRHLAISCPYYLKERVLIDLLSVYGEGGRAIVFTQTKADANSLIQNPIFERREIEVMHGDIPQFTREQTLKKFREGKIKYLVATDVASRGLDIPNVELIVQVEPPKDVETYIHRSGRTARAGKEGTCITFFSNKTSHLMEQIEMTCGIQFDHIQAPSKEEVMRVQSTSAPRDNHGYQGQSREPFQYKSDTDRSQGIQRNKRDDNGRFVDALDEKRSGFQRNQGFINKENFSNNIQSRGYQGGNSNHSEKSFPSRGRGHSNFINQQSRNPDQVSMNSRGRGFGGPGYRNMGDGRSDAGFDGKSMKSSASFAYSTPQSTPHYSENDSYRVSIPQHRQMDSKQVNGGFHKGFHQNSAAVSREEEKSGQTRVYMGNLHFACREEELMNLFRENRLRVVSVVFHRDQETGRSRGTGICEFQTARDAQFAIQNLNGFEYNGRPINFKQYQQPQQFQQERGAIGQNRDFGNGNHHFKKQYNGVEEQEHPRIQPRESNRGFEVGMNAQRGRGQMSTNFGNRDQLEQRPQFRGRGQAMPRY